MRCAAEYCRRPANADVPHSELLSADSRSLAATVQVGCAAGYAPSDDRLARVSCSRHNDTHGVWIGLSAWSCKRALALLYRTRLELTCSTHLPSSLCAQS